MSTAPLTPRRLRLTGVATILVALGTLLVAFASPAAAHHPDITASTECADRGYTVEFTSTSWQPSGGDNSGGANPHIAIYYRFRNGPSGTPTPYTELTWKSGYRYTAANGYQFSDSFPVPDLGQGDRIQLKAVAASAWGNGVAAGASRETTWTTFPTDCAQPGTPDVSSAVECTDFDGTVTITLATTGGDLPVTFVVTDPRTNTTTTRVVAPGGSTSVTLSGFVDGPVSIPVTADGAARDVVLTIACDRPGTPVVEVDVRCAATGGTVVVTLRNSTAAGTAEPIVFTVEDPDGGDPVQRTVPAGSSAEVTFPARPDGPLSLDVTADGTPLDPVTVVIDCGRPGVAGGTLSCVEDGWVLTLTNDGPAPVELSVRKDGVEQQTATVPGAGSIDVLVPLARGATATIGVLDGDTSVYEATVTNTCVDPTTTTTPETTSTTSTTQPPGSSSSLPPSSPSTAQVLGETVRRLPVTGNSSGLFAVAGVVLLGVGLFLLEASRRRA